jgi:hypothetical protein
MSAKSTHVLKSISGGWGVQKSDAARASKIFDNKNLAVEHGRALAKREGTPFYIHREDGSITYSSGIVPHYTAQAGGHNSKSGALSGHSQTIQGSLRPKRAAKKK